MEELWIGSQISRSYIPRAASRACGMRTCSRAVGDLFDINMGLPQCMPGHRWRPAGCGGERGAARTHSERRSVNRWCEVEDHDHLDATARHPAAGGPDGWTAVAASAWRVGTCRWRIPPTRHSVAARCRGELHRCDAPAASQVAGESPRVAPVPTLAETTPSAAKHTSLSTPHGTTESLMDSALLPA